MTGDIVILSPTIAPKEGFPIYFAPAPSESDNRRKMVIEHLFQCIGVEYDFRRWAQSTHGEIVFEFLIVEADFKPI